MDESWATEVALSVGVVEITVVETYLSHAQPLDFEHVFDFEDDHDVRKSLQRHRAKTISGLCFAEDRLKLKEWIDDMINKKQWFSARDIADLFFIDL